MSPRRWTNVVVAAPPDVAGPADLQQLVGVADLIELRLDLLGVRDPREVARWVAKAPRPLLVTVRGVSEGGAFSGSPEAAAELLMAAVAAGVEWIDVESEVLEHLDDLGSTRVLHASHDRVPEPSCRSERGGPAWRKNARRVDDAQGWHALLRAVEASDPATTWVPYGGLACTRGLFAGWGGPTLLFGAPTHVGVVPGQPSLTALLDELRAGEVGPDAQLFGLVGDPPGWSPSPALHNAVFRSQERNALYVPLPGLSLATACSLPVQGLSITTPHKQAAFECATKLSAAARATGVVNTLVRTQDGWSGYNTDALGIAALTGPAQRGATALVWGDGATARSAVHALRAQGYAPRLLSRNASQGRAAAQALGCPYVGPTDNRRTTDVVLVNATPMGAGVPLSSGLAAFPLEGLRVIDAPYRTEGPTDLARRAAQAGVTCSDGRALLVAQAIEQVRLFGGPSDAVAVAALLQMAIEPPPPLWLIGPRGVGKSTTGERVATRCGRPFVDLDSEIGRVTGQAPAHWIDALGWERFREIESDVLERVAGRRGVVVATGGGVVDHEPNQKRLASGLVVWLDAPPDVVLARRRTATGDRPRWPGAEGLADEVRQLDAKRRVHYKRWSHVRVDATEDLAAVVDRIEDLWTDTRV